MKGLWLIWDRLALCAGAIAVSGTLLSRYSDVVADKTGWSGAWVGLVLLATVTSLPDLATGIGSVTLADAPNLAVGNVLQARALNLSYVAVPNVLKRDEPLFQSAGLSHIGLAGFSIIMLAVAGLGLALSLGHIGLYAPALLMLCVMAVRITVRCDRSQRAVGAEKAANRCPAILPQGHGLQS